MGKSWNGESRALSAHGPRWQSQAGHDIGKAMKRLLVLALAAGAPAVAAPGGGIETLPTGYYACELPGDAAGPVGRAVASEDFAIINASSYQADGSTGTYLLTGDDLVMTSGPRQGKRYYRQSIGFLRLNGPDGELRCVRRHRNND